MSFNTFIVTQSYYASCGRRSVSPLHPGTQVLHIVGLVLGQLGLQKPAATSRSLPLYTYTATTCQESLALKQAMPSSLHCCFLIRFRINLIWCATACRASTSSAMQGKLSQFLSAVQPNNEPTSVLLFELAMIQWSTLHVFNSSDPSFYFHNILVLETSEVRWYF